MAYRQIKDTLVEFERFKNKCGLNDWETDACMTKSKHKDEPGVCLTFDCPLAYEAGLDDIKEHDTELYNEHKRRLAFAHSVHHNRKSKIKNPQSPTYLCFPKSR